MVKNKIRLPILLIIILSLFVLLIIKIIDGFKQMDKSFKDYPTTITYTILSEDSGLISSKYWEKLKPNKIFQTKGRSPISFISFGNKYHLIISRIDLIEDISMKTLLHVSNESADNSTGKTYSDVFHDNLFHFKYLDARSVPVFKIYMTLAGDSLQTIISNDSIVSYHLLCRNFSIRYSEEAPADIYTVGKDKPLGMTTIIPMDLLLLKRNKKMYLMIMTPNDSKSMIPSSLLYNVVIGL